MPQDTPPTDAEILALIGQGAIDPDELIAALVADYDERNVISGLQRALERGKITLTNEGMVIAVGHMAEAA